jgi:hypothetical protein
MKSAPMVTTNQEADEKYGPPSSEAQVVFFDLPKPRVARAQKVPESQLKRTPAGPLSKTQNGSHHYWPTSRA